MIITSKKIKQFDFWSQNPCGNDSHNLAELMHHRYRHDSWITKELDNIPRQCKTYLEVGCGQGADSFYICKNFVSRLSYNHFCLKNFFKSILRISINFFHQHFYKFFSSFTHRRTNCSQ